MDNKTAATVAKHFDLFYHSEVFADIIDNFATVCEILQIQPTNYVNFYSTLKSSVKSCQGKNLFKVLDERAKQPIFCDNTVASNQKMVVIGAGPIGMRTAIEAQLMGAKVVVMEKRKSFTRNNVLHLWPWVIEDLKSLGAKNFYPRFCTGTMNHISIRRLQCILLKTALCFGVEVHGGVEFKGVSEPDFEGDSWQLQVSPENHPMSNMSMDILIGAEGKRVTLPGFRRKEFRGKLAIAITANFINKRTTAEAVVEEISGVAFVYKQDFFNTLYEELGIALENIVYYKDETHYFVMTTKKHSLLDRKVLKKDLKDPVALLNPNNVNKENLYSYIRDACDYCTDYQLPSLEFALNHYEQPDVALFDFTSMFASANASHVIERKNSQLLFGLVGDGLLEPFWPTGTGIARGFLGVMDCCWMIKQWASGDLTPSEVMAERESILKLLPQTTHENITKDYKNVSILPKTRYPNLNSRLYAPHQVEHLYESDTPEHKDVPRYAHKSFKELATQFSMKKKMANLKMPVNSSMRFQDGNRRSQPKAQEEEPQIKPSDLYRRMKSQQQKEREDSAEKNSNSSPNNRNSRESAERPRNGARKQEEPVMVNPLLSRKEKVKTILNDEASKAEFVKKMSKTFGYGLPSNVEEKPDTLAQEAEKCALLVKSSNIRQSNINKGRKKRSTGAEPGQETKKTESKKETKKTESKKKMAPSQSRDREVQPWNFDRNANSQELHSSVAPIIPSLDIEIDPELDLMLAELEEDDDFSKLSENDQKTWLESLFFQDTLNLPGRTLREHLNKAKQGDKPSLRVNNALSGNVMKGPQRNKNTENDTKKSEDRRSKPDIAEIKPEPQKLAATPSSLNKNLNAAPAKATPPATPTRKSSQNLERTSQNLDRASQNMDDSSRRFSATSNLNTSRKPVDLDLDLELDDIDLDGIDLEDLDLDLDDKKDNKFSRKSSASSYSTPPMTRPSQTKESSATPSMNESIDQISGVNKNLCSLAQAYFSGPAKKPTVTRKPSVKETPEPTPATRPVPARNPTPPEPAPASRPVPARNPTPPEPTLASRPVPARNPTPPEPDLEAEEEEKVQKEKESLVAAFFGKPTKATKAPQQNTKVIERASFAPSAGAGSKGANRSSGLSARGKVSSQANEDDREREELEELEKIMEGSGAATEMEETRTPTPPPRGPLDKQALMVRMLGNVNGILNGKIKPGKK